MNVLLAGLAGGIVGALTATAIILHVFRQRGDRDLAVRRIRACSEYLEFLGRLERAFERSGAEPEILEQAWHSTSDFCRELRLTGWLFSTVVRGALGALVDDLEKAERLYRENGCGSSGRTAQLLCEKYHEVGRILQGELTRAQREFRRPRFLSSPGDRRD